MQSDYRREDSLSAEQHQSSRLGIAFLPLAGIFMLILSIVLLLGRFAGSEGEGNEVDWPTFSILFTGIGIASGIGMLRRVMFARLAMLAIAPWLILAIASEFPTKLWVHNAPPLYYLVTLELVFLTLFFFTSRGPALLSQDCLETGWIARGGIVVMLGIVCTSIAVILVINDEPGRMSWFSRANYLNDLVKREVVSKLTLAHYLLAMIVIAIPAAHPDKTRPAYLRRYPSSKPGVVTIQIVAALVGVGFVFGMFENISDVFKSRDDSDGMISMSEIGSSPPISVKPDKREDDLLQGDNLDALDLLIVQTSTSNARNWGKSLTLAPALKDRLSQYNGMVTFKLKANGVRETLVGDGARTILPVGAHLDGEFTGKLNATVRFSDGEVGVRDSKVYATNGTRAVVNGKVYEYDSRQWRATGEFEVTAKQPIANPQATNQESPNGSDSQPVDIVRLTLTTPTTFTFGTETKTHNTAEAVELVAQRATKGKRILLFIVPKPEWVAQGGELRQRLKAAGHEHVIVLEPRKPATGTTTTGKNDSPISPKVQSPTKDGNPNSDTKPQPQPAPKAKPFVVTGGQPASLDNITINTVKPNLPPSVRLLAPTKQVRARVHFDPKGKVIRAELAHSSGSESVDKSVLISIYRWSATFKKTPDSIRVVNVEINLEE